MDSPVAFLFPGQGTQIVGMGAELARKSTSAKLVFEQVNDAISENLFSIMKDGPEDILQLTRNAQPAIFASSIAVMATIEERSIVGLAKPPGRLIPKEIYESWRAEGYTFEDRVVLIEEFPTEVNE